MDHRRACYGVLRFIMESGAKGCEVIVSGKLRAARAKAMKFKDGYMISSGQPAVVYIDAAVRHVLLRQGVLGIKVGILLDGWSAATPRHCARLHLTPPQPRLLFASVGQDHEGLGPDWKARPQDAPARCRQGQFLSSTVHLQIAPKRCEL